MSISSSSFRRSLLTFVLIGDKLANLPCSKDLKCLIALCTERSELPKDTPRLEIFVTSCASGNNRKEEEELTQVYMYKVYMYKVYMYIYVLYSQSIYVLYSSLKTGTNVNLRSNKMVAKTCCPVPCA